MLKSEWKPRSRAEQEYARVLWQAFKRFSQESISPRVLSSTEFLVKYAWQAAVRMITGLYFEGAKTWREAARESGRSVLMYRSLQQELNGPVGVRMRELIRQNAELISSFPTSVARKVASAAAAQQLAGGRARGIQGMVSGVVRSRAQLIARTEVHKASSALTQARSEELGINWYVWETSQDERTRLSHKKLQGVLIPFDNPPSPEALIGEKTTLGHYNAGNAPNCRCYPAPVVRVETLKWPHRVYYANRIQFMTLANFKLLGKRRVAA